MRVKCLAQEHNTVTRARARTRTTRSGDERTNHEATAAPTLSVKHWHKSEKLEHNVKTLIKIEDFNSNHKWTRVETSSRQPLLAKSFIFEISQIFAMHYPLL